MYLRFEPQIDDPESDYVWSLFGAVGQLLENGDLTRYEHRRLSELDNWFTSHLREPTRLARSRRYHAENKAVCWFKSSASACIDKLREIVSILEHHDIPVRMVKSTHPGYIVYEDEYQVAAEPYRDR